MKAPSKELGTERAPVRRAGPPARPTVHSPADLDVRDAVASTAAPSRALNPAVAQRLQAAAGNRAVSALITARRTATERQTRPVQRFADGAGAQAPAAPVPATGVDVGPVPRPPASADPKFAALRSDVQAKQQAMSAHPPASSEAAKAHAAAKPPRDDKEAQGKTANAEKMNAAKPGEFDKAGFIRAVNEAIAAQAPKNLDEADKFGDSGKADAVKGQVRGQVTAGTANAAKAIATTTNAAPDTSAAKDKQVTPLVADHPPGTPGTPDPAKAVPDTAPAAATDFSAGPRQVDQQMAHAQVTEDQLAKSNEPEFTDALTDKKAGEHHAATAPGQVRAVEAQTLTEAKAQAGQAGSAAMAALAGHRKAAGAQVGAGKDGAKGEDEQKRAQVTATLQTVFDATKKDVEEILSGLDKKVDDQFSAGEKVARDAFTAEHKRRMDEYKDRRYSGLRGKARWIRDKFAGLPEEANQIFVTARKGYVDRMQQVIAQVADTIGAELNRAKARIAAGRNELQATVRSLSPQLRAIGEKAAKEFAGRFDELTESVDDKGKELVNTLASRYNEALRTVDDEIAAEKEKNKGLVAKAVDAVGGVIKTILELKDMLLGVLAKAAEAVMAILKDPIGFLGNLVSAVGAGLKAFLANIGEHLKNGLAGFLLGALAGAGLVLPAKFDLRGIISMIGSLLGLTWNALRTRIIQRGIPEKAMSAVETAVPIAAKIQSEGVAGVTEEIEEQVGDLKDNLFSKISEYLIPTVLVAGVTWILSLLNPASAFVKACKMIIDFVTFIVQRGAQIIEFVNSVLDAIVAIAGGGAGGVPALIEKALAKSVPVLIGALAAILGIGGIAEKIKNFFQALTKPVMKAVNWVIDKIVAAGKKIWAKLKGMFGKKDKEEGQGKPAQAWWLEKKGLQAPNGESHTLLFQGAGRGATLMIHSNEQSYRSYLNSAPVADGDDERKGAKAEALQALLDIEQLEGSGVPDAQKKQQMPGLLDRLAAATIKLIGDSGTLPESTPPIYGGLSSGGFATTMTVTMLTTRGPAGSAPSASMSNPVWDVLLTRYEKAASRRRFYKLGHLLSYKMHGPGDQWSNLSPQSESGNQLFERGAERQVKGLLDQNKGVRYTVTAIYGSRSNGANLVAQWTAANDPKLAEKKKIVDAENLVPLAFEWSYQVVFENGKPVTNGEAGSGSAPNDIRQEADKYHVQ